MTTLALFIINQSASETAVKYGNRTVGFFKYNKQLKAYAYRLPNDSRANEIITEMGRFTTLKIKVAIKAEQDGKLVDITPELSVLHHDIEDVGETKGSQVTPEGGESKPFAEIKAQATIPPEGTQAAQNRITGESEGLEEVDDSGEGLEGLESQGNGQNEYENGDKRPEGNEDYASGLDPEVESVLQVMDGTNALKISALAKSLGSSEVSLAKKLKDAVGKDGKKLFVLSTSQGIKKVRIA